MFGRIGTMELILILAIALIIFGPSKLPQIGKSLGSAINSFKSSVNKKVDDEPQAEAEKPKQLTQETVKEPEKKDGANV